MQHGTWLVIRGLSKDGRERERERGYKRYSVHASTASTTGIARTLYTARKDIAYTSPSYRRQNTGAKRIDIER